MVIFLVTVVDPCIPLLLENMAKFVSFLLMIKDISKNSYTRLSNRMFRQHSSCLNKPSRSTDCQEPINIYRLLLITH